MKKVITMIFAAACLAIMASTAMAVPVVPTYAGNTYSTIGAGKEPTGTTQSGYYLWSNDAERTNWSVRWTNQGTGANINWFGQIFFLGASGDPTATRKVDFESTGEDKLLVNSTDLIKYQAVSGPAWDGIDFTITGEEGNLLGFNLGSDLFGNLTKGRIVTASNIFIGQNFAHPDVLVQSYTPLSGKTSEYFNVPAPVPEPGTMMLLGAGFLGLAIYGKRRRNA